MMPCELATILRHFVQSYSLTRISISLLRLAEEVVRTCSGYYPANFCGPAKVYSTTTRIHSLAWRLICLVRLRKEA